MKKKFGMDSILREEKTQWWENIGCIMYCESSICLTSFLTSFLRCYKDIDWVLWARLTNPTKNNSINL